MSDLSDDTLMALPASMVAHLLRTAAQDGFQVVSPRQIPVSEMLTRIVDADPRPMTVTVGSDAALTEYWPTAYDDDPIDMNLIPGAPSVKYGEPLVKRQPTDVESLRVEKSLENNPLEKSLIMARSVVDFQSREDIGGDSEALAEAIEDAWGLPTGLIMDRPEITVDASVDLLRYAIARDTAFPKILAPIHQRRVIATHTREGSREALGAHKAVDWNRMRTVAELKYLLTVRNEHHDLTIMSLSPLGMVGTVSPVHPHVLTYQLSRGSGWTCDPATFALAVMPAKNRERRVLEVPERIMDALTHKSTQARVFALMKATSVKAQWERVVAADWDTSTPNVLHGALSEVFSRTSHRDSYGKTVERELRGLVYEAITSAPQSIKMKLARALRSLNEVCAALSMKPTSGVMALLAQKLVNLNKHIHVVVSDAAAMRGVETSLWWTVAMERMPKDLRLDNQKAGTWAWAYIAVYHLIASKDDAWMKLSAALMHDAMRPLMEFSSRVEGSSYRVGTWGHMQAALNTATSIWKNEWFNAYDGEALGALLAARMTKDKGALTVSEALYTAHKTWAFLARAVRTYFVRLNVTTDAKDKKEHRHAQEVSMNMNPVALEGEFTEADTVHIVVQATPYAPYNAMAKGMEADTSKVAQFVAGHIPKEITKGSVAASLKTVRYRLPTAHNLTVPFMNTRAMRWVRSISELGEKIEATLNEYRADMVSVSTAVTRVAKASARAELASGAGASTSGTHATMVGVGPLELPGHCLNPNEEDDGRKSGWELLKDVDEYVHEYFVGLHDENSENEGLYTLNDRYRDIDEMEAFMAGAAEAVNAMRAINVLM